MKALDKVTDILKKEKLSLPRRRVRGNRKLFFFYGPRSMSIMGHLAWVWVVQMPHSAHHIRDTKCPSLLKCKLCIKCTLFQTHFQPNIESDCKMSQIVQSLRVYSTNKS